MQSESKVYKQNKSFVSSSYNSRNIIDSLRVRGASEGMPYLEGTATEVEAIAQLAKSSKIKTTTLTGVKGNEESFKALSGENIQIVHIATHGFYWTKEAVKASEQGDLGDEMPRRSTEDKALSRSGLLMAGADNALEGNVPEDIEDGILTAQEIAQLDLSNLYMVVLSACETALGDVSKSEGIFGLQRGFKKAGANSILMSLWKVDDEATSMLMTEFYKFWLSGETKHDALELAKDVVRSHQEKGWNDPKYWAAFIMLDGLN
jgi:CHAT domain-containing protein